MESTTHGHLDQSSIARPLWTRRLLALMIDGVCYLGLILIGLSLLLVHQEGFGFALILLGLGLDIVCSSPLTQHQSIGRTLCSLSLHRQTTYPWRAAILRGITKWTACWLIVAAGLLSNTLVTETLSPIITFSIILAGSLGLTNLLVIWLTHNHQTLHEYLSGLTVTQTHCPPLV